MQLGLALGAIQPATGAMLRVESLGQLPLYFVENRGQLDRAVTCCVRGQDKTVCFACDGLTITLNKPACGNEDSSWLAPAAATRSRMVTLSFVGARADAGPRCADATSAVVSYFRGPPDQWQAGRPTFRRVVYKNLWPGIDLIYSGTVNRMKHEFIVHPGANPSAIRLSCRGAALRLDPSGRLEFSTPVDTFHDDAPVGFQERDGQRLKVEAAYVLGEPAGNVSREYFFWLGDYDHSRELVIDPDMIIWCGFIGGLGSDGIAGVATDTNGNVYVVGTVQGDGTGFPITAGSFNGPFTTSDAFVAKLTSAGALVYCGFIGGYGYETGTGIAVDAVGNAYVAGTTGSKKEPSGGYPGFPWHIGPGTNLVGADSFIAKISASGTNLGYAGYIGGNNPLSGGVHTVITGIGVDTNGSAIVVGFTDCDQTNDAANGITGFPVAVGPDGTFNSVPGPPCCSPPADAFIAKVAPDGTGFLYCGYIGGDYEERAQAVAVDRAGNAYVTGFTATGQPHQSNDFPTLIGPDLTGNGANDAFVAKVSPGGTLLYCGFIGGDNHDYGYGIAVQADGSAFVTGETQSPQSTFPVLMGPDVTFNGGTTEAFVAKVKPDGSGLLYCGYLGGSGNDRGNAIAVDRDGNAYVAGYTESANFPAVLGPRLQAYPLPFGGVTDAFVSKVSSNGASLLYSGYLGGTNYDEAFGIAVDADGNAYVAGKTKSKESEGFPVKSFFDMTYNDTSPSRPGDAFLAKISSSVCGGCAIQLAAPSVTSANGTNFVGLAFVPCGCNHFVEYVNALDGRPWTTLAGAPHNSGVANDTNTAPYRFYRVRLAP